MNKPKTHRITDLGVFFVFVRHFARLCYMVRALLGAQFILVALLGALFAWWEGLPIFRGIYLSFITATTVGYGDITPETTIGHVLSIVIAFVGLILFGFIVAIANQAFSITIKDVLKIETFPSLDE